MVRAAHDVAPTQRRVSLAHPEMVAVDASLGARGPDGRLPTQATLTTVLNLSSARVVGCSSGVGRSRSPFEKVRCHLGVETHRQWNDLAIARTTPMLMKLFSLVCLIAYQWRESSATLPRSTAWYLKSYATFSD